LRLLLLSMVRFPKPMLRRGRRSCMDYLRRHSHRDTSSPLAHRSRRGGESGTRGYRDRQCTALMFPMLRTKQCMWRSRARPANRLVPALRSLRALEPHKAKRRRRSSIALCTSLSRAGRRWISSTTTQLAARAHGNDQQGREHLCRYILRPPFAFHHLHTLHNNKIQLDLPRPRA